MLADAGADDHEILEDERRHGERFPAPRVRRAARPEEGAGPRVERDQVPVRRSAYNPTVFEGHASVARIAVGARRIPLVPPA